MPASAEYFYQKTYRQQLQEGRVECLNIQLLCHLQERKSPNSTKPWKVSVKREQTCICYNSQILTLNKLNYTLSQLSQSNKSWHILKISNILANHLLDTILMQFETHSFTRENEKNGLLKPTKLTQMQTTYNLFSLSTAPPKVSHTHYLVFHVGSPFIL